MHIRGSGRQEWRPNRQRPRHILFALIDDVDYNVARVGDLIPAYEGGKKYGLYRLSREKRTCCGFSRTYRTSTSSYSLAIDAPFPFMRYNQKLRLGLGGEVRETTAVAMGLMLYWPMLRSPYFQNLFFASASTSFGGREAYAVANILIAGIAVIALGGARRFLRRPMRPAPLAFTFLVGFACAIAAVLLLVSAQLTSSLAFAMKLAGIALFAVSFSAITFGWFSLLLASCRNWGFVVAVSFAASFASVGIEYLPNGAVQASLVVFPLATSLFLMIANRLAKQPKRNRVSAPYSPSIPGVDGIVLAATCFCLIASVPSLCLFAPTSGYMPTSETPKTYIFSVLVSVAMAEVMKLHKPFLVKQGIVLIILSAILIVGSLALASTDNAMPVAATAHTCLQFALFLALLSFWREKQNGGLGGASTFLAITSLLAIVSRYLLPIAFPKGSSETISAMLGMASIVILSIAGMCLALSAILRLPSIKDGMSATDADAKSRELTPFVIGEPKAPFTVLSDVSTQPGTQGVDEALRAWLEDAFPLSPRETDIALLVARGYTVNRIAENLCLASGTVQSHMKSIYRKLDVHSKQEVIDLVQSQSVNH